MSTQASQSIQENYKPALYWLGLGALVWITFLLYAGGFTTSIRAGMAFLDWPLSNGSINPEGWTSDQDMMAEHSHRLLGMVMGLLSIGLLVASYALKARPTIKRGAVAIVCLVLAQGVLGGLRVKLDQLNLDIDHNLYAQTFAVAHATLAQLFLCLLVSFVVSNSRSWIERQAGFGHAPSRALANWGLAACAAIVLQLIIGAIMRHSYAGLAITTFPYSSLDGHIIPPAFDFKVAIHFAHRVGAVVVSIVIVAFCVKIWRDSNARKALSTSAVALAILLMFQGYLGYLVIKTVRNPHVATVHMLNGAVVLALCWSMAYRCLRYRIGFAGHETSDKEPSCNQEKLDLPAASSQG